MSEYDEEFQETRPPSKSSRKREALYLQKLGEQLVKMRPEETATLPLGEQLGDAITEARRLTSHGGLSRQYQYIGKLMRGLDVDAIEDALVAQTDAQKARARLKR
jgi:ribosome-associated protein